MVAQAALQLETGSVPAYARFFLTETLSSRLSVEHACLLQVTYQPLHYCALCAVLCPDISEYHIWVGFEGI